MIPLRKCRKTKSVRSLRGNIDQHRGAILDLKYFRIRKTILKLRIDQTHLAISFLSALVSWLASH